jgi:hypothetical protein
MEHCDWIQVTPTTHALAGSGLAWDDTVGIAKLGRGQFRYNAQNLGRRRLYDCSTRLPAFSHQQNTLKLAEHQINDQEVRPISSKFYT